MTLTAQAGCLVKQCLSCTYNWWDSNSNSDIMVTNGVMLVTVAAQYDMAAPRLASAWLS